MACIVPAVRSRQDKRLVQKSSHALAVRFAVIIAVRFFSRRTGFGIWDLGFFRQPFDNRTPLNYDYRLEYVPYGMVGTWYPTKLHLRL